MNRKFGLLAAIPVVAGLLAASVTPAEAYWNRGYGYRGGYYHRGYGIGPGVAGAIVGLGVGAAIAGAYAPRPYYAPPPVYYAPPPVVYAPAPGYYAPY